jgi:microcystin degradation protein MlrC
VTEVTAEHKKSPRIAVGQIFQESHDFSPVQTETKDFVIEYGQEALTKNLAAGSTFGGIVGCLARSGANIVPVLAARARPGGPLSQATYEALKADVLAGLAKALPLDAVVFELHGGMTACGIGSTEADLLPAIRALVGPQTVIAVGLDLHGHASDAMLGAANIVTACKQHPHRDVVETGERAARLALRTLDGSIKPVSALARIPLLLRGGYETVQQPLGQLHAKARTAIAGAAGRLLDVSIFNVQPFLDLEKMGQAFIAISDDRPELAGQVVRDLARECWARREEFVDEFADLESVFATMEKNPADRPFVLSDYGDRVLAGAPGDSIEVLRTLIDSGRALSCAIPITDPEAVSEAVAAGVGAQVRLRVGGKLTPNLQPMLVEGVVLAITDGTFVQRGPYQRGQETSLGRSAVIKSGKHYVLVTTLAGMTQDPNAFTSQGIDLDKVDFFVTKSGNHFKVNFDGLATPLVAATPGLSMYEPGALPFRHARVYPDHDVDASSLEITYYDNGLVRREVVALQPGPGRRDPT